MEIEQIQAGVRSMGRFEISEYVAGEVKNTLEFIGELGCIREYANIKGPFGGGVARLGDLRPDAPKKSLSRKKAFQNAPEVDKNMFVVPIVVE